MPANSNDGTETSLRNIVTLLSGESGEIVSSPNDSTEESLRKVVTLLGSGSGANTGLLAGVQWTDRHTNSTGNPYLVGSIVYNAGRVYRCIAENDSMPTPQGGNDYWADLGVGYLLPNENPKIEGGSINTAGTSENFVFKVALPSTCGQYAGSYFHVRIQNPAYYEANATDEWVKAANGQVTIVRDGGIFYLRDIGIESPWPNTFLAESTTLTNWSSLGLVKNITVSGFTGANSGSNGSYFSSGEGYFSSTGGLINLALGTIESLPDPETGSQVTIATKVGASWVPSAGVTATNLTVALDTGVPSTFVATLTNNTKTGGAITTSGGGGSIDTSGGGGSIDTRGTGSIELGLAGIRTTLNGSATEDRTIILPNATGTIALTNSFTLAVPNVDIGKTVSSNPLGWTQQVTIPANIAELTGGLPCLLDSVGILITNRLGTGQIHSSSITAAGIRVGSQSVLTLTPVNGVSTYNADNYFSTLQTGVRPWTGNYSKAFSTGGTFGRSLYTGGDLFINNPIVTGTFRTEYWNATLTEAMDATQTTLLQGIVSGGTAYEGTYLKIDNEVVLVTSWTASGFRPTILRAQLGTTATTHALGATVTANLGSALGGGILATVYLHFIRVG